MAATIKIKNSSTTGSVPTAGNLVQGELAVNVTDLGLYTENASGTVVKLNAPSIDDKNTGATKYLTIDTSGNLGLGVTPSAWTTYTNVLQTPSISLATNGAASVLGTNWYYDGQNRYKTTGYATLYVSTSGQHQFYTAASGTAGNTLSSLTQAMTLDASGNLLVGTTSQVNSGKVCFVGDFNSSNGIVLKTTYASTGSIFALFANSAGSTAGYITQNGTTTVQYVTSSDYRLKENIAPMTGALAKVAALKPCTYTWKEDGSVGQGFIAHELQEVVPDAVAGNKDDVYEDGSIKPQGIDTSFLVATLTAAIQELNAKFEAYKASHP
jgi:hypothetical protein